MNRHSRRGLSEREIRRKINAEKNAKEASILEIPQKNLSRSNQFKNTGIKISNERDVVVITIPKSFIGKLNSFDLANHIGMLTSPLFFQKDTHLKSSKYKEKKFSKNGMPNIAVFMNNIRHYSGGRYYAVMFAKLLASIGCNVTLVSDYKPFFIDDFKYIEDNGRLNFRYDTDESIWCSKDAENYYDLVIGVPNLAGVHAFNYAKKWNKPVYMMIFETPNYVSQYRGGLDSGEGYWSEYKKCLAECDRIICLAKVPLEEAVKWLKVYNVPADRYTYLYPAVNTYVADMAPEVEEKNEITFIGRHTDFKNPNHVVKAVARMKCKKPAINFIGTHSERTRILLNDTAVRYKVKINFYANINDLDKFKIIKRSKVVCIPTVFEGFGIPPAEALYCKKPAVVYDIPVLKDVYQDKIDYAPIGSVEILSSKIEKLLCDDKYRKKKAEEGYKYICKTCHPNIKKNNIRNIILNQKFLEISVGMICLNGEDTIEYSLRSVYNSVKEILIVEGAVEDYARVNPEMVNSKFGSIDNTLSIVKNFPDPLGKIKLLSHSRKYKSKMEMQNIIAENITGDIYLKVDSDEIYKEYDIERIRNEFIIDPNLTIFRYKFYHFWHGLDKVAVGGQWESKMTRCWRWDNNFRHSETDPTGFNFYYDKDDDKVDLPKYKIKDTDDYLVYHLNYANQDSKKILAKINYYKNRGIESQVTDTWSNWEPGKSTSPTHRGGTVNDFDGELPIVLRDIKVDNRDVKKKIDRNLTLMDSPVKRSSFKVTDRRDWTIGMIVLNEERFVENNIINLLNWKRIAKIVVVEGADENYPKTNVTSDGLSKDNTTSILKRLSSKYPIIDYVPKGFSVDKQDLRNEYMKRATGDFLLVVDADEFYGFDYLNKIDNEVKKSPIETIQWEFQRDDLKNGTYGGIVHFWHNLKYRVVGGYYSIPHQRIYRFIPGMLYKDSHNHPEMPDGTRIDKLRHRWGKTSARYYHAGFMKDFNNMRDKQDYYYNRGEKSDKPMYSTTRELWFNWDGKTMEYPQHKMKIINYNGFIPDALRESIYV